MKVRSFETFIKNYKNALKLFSCTFSTFNLFGRFVFIKICISILVIGDLKMLFAIFTQLVALSDRGNLICKLLLNSWVN